MVRIWVFLRDFSFHKILSVSVLTLESGWCKWQSPCCPSERRVFRSVDFRSSIDTRVTAAPLGFVYYQREWIDKVNSFHSHIRSVLPSSVVARIFAYSVRPVQRYCQQTNASGSTSLVPPRLLSPCYLQSQTSFEASTLDGRHWFAQIGCDQSRHEDPFPCSGVRILATIGPSVP